MFVSELIDFVSLFVFGRVEPTEDDRVNYLNYLNLANYELYRCKKNSRRSLQTLELFFDPALNYAPLPENYICAVYSNKVELETIEVLYNLDSTVNKYYYFLNNNIYVNKNNLPIKVDPNDGVNKSYLNLIILPSRKTLVENVVNPDLEVDTPEYPDSYHLGLVHGAIYYLFLSQKGFTEKIQYAIKNWQEVKSDLTAYYSQDK